MRLTASVPRNGHTPARETLRKIADPCLWGGRIGALPRRCTALSTGCTAGARLGFPPIRVPAHEIAPIVSAWLAELGAHSPLVDDLARAACVANWAAAYAVGDQLSVDVALAAAA